MSRNPVIIVPVTTVINLADRRCVLAWENGGASKDPKMYGLSGFSASTNYYFDNVDQGPFETAPFTLITAYRVTANIYAGGAYATAFGRANNNSTGGHWQGVRLSACTAAVADNGGVTISPTFSVVANRTHIVVSTLDASNGTLRLYNRDGEVGSGTSVTSYTAPPAGIGPSFGSRNSAGTHEFNRDSQTGQVAFAGAIEGVAVTEAQAQTWIAACEGQRDLAGPPTASGTFYGWSVKRQQQGTLLNPWTPYAGPDTEMDLTGSLTLSSWLPSFS